MIYIQKMFRKLCRKFSPEFYELGPQIDIKKLASENVRLFRLGVLKSMQQLDELPDGEVVAVTHSGPSQIDISIQTCYDYHLNVMLFLYFKFLLVKSEMDEKFKKLTRTVELQNEMINSLNLDVKVINVFIKTV